MRVVSSYLHRTEAAQHTAEKTDQEDVALTECQHLHECEGRRVCQRHTVKDEEQLSYMSALLVQCPVKRQRTLETAHCVSKREAVACFSIIPESDPCSVPLLNVDADVERGVKVVWVCCAE